MYIYQSQSEENLYRMSQSLTDFVINLGQIKISLIFVLRRAEQANGDNIFFLLPYGWLWRAKQIMLLVKNYNAAAAAKSLQSCLTQSDPIDGQRFTVKHDISYGFVICGLDYVEAGSLSEYFLESFFYHKWMLNFIKSFLWISWDDHMVFILPFVNALYHWLTWR